MIYLVTLRYESALHAFKDDKAVDEYLAFGGKQPKITIPHRELCLLVVDRDENTNLWHWSIRAFSGSEYPSPAPSEHGDWWHGEEIGYANWRDAADVARIQFDDRYTPQGVTQ